MNKKIIIFVVVVVVAAAAVILAFLLSSSGTISQPAPGDSQSKINIDEVCEGALAYMSFPSGVEAEAFVKDCKEGKHPQVIEQWKKDNNITDDRAI